jgi:hypothetical protein
MSGNLVLEQISATNLTINGTISHPDGASSRSKPTGTLHLKAGALIDASGHGLRTQRYVSRRDAARLRASAARTSASAVSGTGRRWGRCSAASTVRVKQAAAARATTSEGRNGGGLVRINAGTLIVDGAIQRERSRSQSRRSTSAAAPRAVRCGSPRIASAAAARSKRMARRAGTAAGGGGAIAIEYTDPASTLPTLSAFTGTHVDTSSMNGGAGSIYIKGPNARRTAICSSNSGTAIPADGNELPSLGSGVALSGSSGLTLVTSRTNIRAYFEGHYIEITASNGVVKGTRRVAISSINGSTLTLEDRERHAVDRGTGDGWRGVYLFDNVTTKRHASRRERSMQFASSAAADHRRLAGPRAASTRAISPSSRMRSSPRSSDHSTSTIKVDEQLRVETPVRRSIERPRLRHGSDVSRRNSIPGNGNGGSAHGRGRLLEAQPRPTYGSVVASARARRRQRLLDAVGRSSRAAARCPIEATRSSSMASIRANGAGDNVDQNSRGGAGGSIWIRTVVDRRQRHH